MEAHNTTSIYNIHKEYCYYCYCYRQSYGIAAGNGICFYQINRIIWAFSFLTAGLFGHEVHDDVIKW